MPAGSLLGPALNGLTSARLDRWARSGSPVGEALALAALEFSHVEVKVSEAVRDARARHARETGRCVAAALLPPPALTSHNAHATRAVQPEQDIVVNLPEHGFHLRFEARSQALRLIEARALSAA
jgi:hypothetical protein